MSLEHFCRKPLRFDRTLGIVTLDDLIAQVGNEVSEIGKTISQDLPRENA